MEAIAIPAEVRRPQSGHGGGICLLCSLGHANVSTVSRIAEQSYSQSPIPRRGQGKSGA